MKVLHVIPSISPSLGGPTQVVLNSVKALRDCGVDAEIVTTNHNCTTTFDVPLYQKTEYEQVPVWFLPYTSPALKEFIFSAPLTQWLWQNVRNYDILDNHYLFSYAPTCAGAIARWYKVPYTVRVQGQLSSWALTQSKLKKQVYSLLIERHNLNHAAAIHCASTEEAKDVRKFGIDTRTVILPLGVEKFPKFPQAKTRLRSVYGIPEQTPVILFLSRLRYNKRPDLLIKALSHIANLKGDFHLILAGDGEPNYVNYLQQLVTSLNLSNCVTFAGFVANEQKNLLLQGADLFVLPSLSENFSIAAAEAMAAGLPVIVSSEVQIAPDIITANTGLVVEGEIEPLIKAILRLLDSPTFRQVLGENGRRLAIQNYSWDSIALSLANVYEALIRDNATTLSEILTFS
ncbi:glycosyltransferase [Nostoc sp. PCC 7107]|uniref:glycosyltransferase n=1 Tax=Nostoc sp. PCC 7107 TaxID=317936 RepID=UPI00029F00AA|nr:glycosyltransferase [Nostoc sp. PCC 7107]AFY43933.1 glycosyl transferase group 1 [Nostoc sp. PCC 7107]